MKMVQMDRGVMKMLLTFLVVVLVSLASGGKRAGAEVHHVVGDDRGWAPSTDLDSWLSGRVFNIGDILWFAYSSVQESIMEVQTLEEFLLCDIRNPIRTYTKGLDKVPLDREGTRYFASSNLESCKKGLKLPVNVQPQPLEKKTLTGALAQAPIPPSTAHSIGISFALFLGLIISFVGI